jgi:hypothetical protein
MLPAIDASSGFHLSGSWRKYGAGKGEFDPVPVEDSSFASGQGSFGFPERMFLLGDCGFCFGQSVAKVFVFGKQAKIGTNQNPFTLGHRSRRHRRRLGRGVLGSHYVDAAF